VRSSLEKGDDMTLASLAIGTNFGATPNTPDLGCFIRTVHPFELDYEFHIWEELSPVILGLHQVYFRVMCGEAAYFQRCHVYLSDMWVPPGWPGDALLGGDHTPRPSDWEKFPVQTRPRRYFFHGEHRNPATSTWHRDAAVGHAYELYENGTLSRVGWDDTGGDMDLNDLTVEVAVVRRRRWLDDFTVAEVDEVALARFTNDVMPSRHGDHRHDELPNSHN
jgi:hypothetical protein